MGQFIAVRGILCRHPRPVILYRDPGVVDDNLDLRSDVGLLAGVERVVDQLLQHHQRPSVGLVPGLSDQFLLGAEVEEAAGA